jgi:gliding motility-associated protein GldM
MSKEVLSAFGILNNKIESSNSITDTRNESSFLQLQQKAKDQPLQYGDKKAKVDKIRALCKEYSDYIEGIKTTITKGFPKDKEGNYPCEQMDKSDAVDNLFYNGDKESKEGKEFLERIRGFAGQLKAIGGSSIAEVEMKKIEKRFETKDVYSEKAEAKLPWLDYNYHHFPLIASVTKLTQLQADIKTTESDIMEGMFKSDLVAAASLTAYQPIVVPEKTAFFQGEAVKGKIILGKFDPNLVAKSVVVNGVSVPAKAGQADFSFGAGAVGEHEITGSFNFDENGKVISLPIKGNYVVVPQPKSANISADKMNVVYRGLPNPMTISFAGISDDKVSASAPGLTRATVTAKLPDGKPVSDSKIFRIKNIPAPAGAIGGVIGVQKGAKSRLEVSQISAQLQDFLYDLNFQVTRFSFKVPGQAAIIVSGDRVNAQCKAALARATKGDQISIFDIKTKIMGTTANIVPKDAAPVIYEIQ